MRLFLDDTFATGTYTVPIFADWLQPTGITADLVARLSADAVSVDDAALVPSSELLHLQQSHVVIPEIAVIADAAGAVAMRVPIRPDEIESTPIRLLDTSGTAELLARATLTPFYGIHATDWIRDDASPDAAQAEVVIVEGAEALREPEAGLSEDLIRSWFILTAQPFVSHLLLVPRELPMADRALILGLLHGARTEGLAQRRKWRPALADREEIPRERANAFWAAQRFALDSADQAALRELFQRGTAGTSRSPRLNVEFIEGAGSA